MANERWLCPFTGLWSFHVRIVDVFADPTRVYHLSLFYVDGVDGRGAGGSRCTPTQLVARRERVAWIPFPCSSTFPISFPQCIALHSPSFPLPPPPSPRLLLLSSSSSPPWQIIGQLPSYSAAAAVAHLRCLKASGQVSSSGGSTVDDWCHLIGCHLNWYHFIWYHLTGCHFIWCKVGWEVGLFRGSGSAARATGWHFLRRGGCTRPVDSMEVLPNPFDCLSVAPLFSS